MTTTNSPASSGSSAGAGGSAGFPHLDVDPFSIEFFADPYPTHERLRETGPVVYLDKWNVYAVARHAEVHAVLNDPLTFCSSRGVGLSDFAKEKPWRPQSIILEADPPAHTRTRAVLNQVLSASVMRPLRERFAAAAAAKVDELLALKSADAGDITEAEAPLLVRSLLSAGIDTTVNGIGAAVYCLARFPDQLARLRQDPTLARNAFEEAIRFESPVQTFFRTTTREVEISGHRIGEGEKVLMFLGSANRDPRRWDNADRYDIGRKTSGHVGYGSGIHMCVGQLVARLEGEVMMAALARKVAAIEITGPVKRRYNNTLRGLESLPATMVPA